AARRAVRVAGPLSVICGDNQGNASSCYSPFFRYLRLFASTTSWSPYHHSFPPRFRTSPRTFCGLKSPDGLALPSTVRHGSNPLLTVKYNHFPAICSFRDAVNSTFTWKPLGLCGV